MTHLEKGGFFSINIMALFEFDFEPKTEIKNEETKPVKKRTVTYEELVHINRTVPIEGYSDFTPEKYPYGVVFYDFEVFMYDWLVVIIDPVYKEKTIICNNRAALKEYFDFHSNMIWIGYNNKFYDVQILKGILLGYDPKEISDKLIIDRLKPFQMKEYDFYKIKMYSYDVMAKKEPPESLKLLEAYMGNDIEETEVDFNLNRPLNKVEIGSTIKYCTHDVEQTIEVFRFRIDDFEQNINLVETFGFPFEYVNKTKGQITAMVTDCEKQEHNDEFDISFVPVLEINRYAYVRDWYIQVMKQHDYYTPIPNTKENAHILSKGKQIKKNKDSRVSFETNVYGIPCTFGFGGLHGAADKAVHASGKMYHSDISSFYPSEMIGWGMLSRNAKHPEKFEEVYHLRLKAKKEGNKKVANVLKIVINSQYGITKDKTSAAYDPVQANNICINGQMMILDLLEHLEDRLGNRVELIQANTDGIIVRLDEDEKTERIYRHICDEWCYRMKLSFAHDEIGVPGRIGKNGEPLHDYVAKDVNNYVFMFSNGKIETKGAYVRENNPLDNNTAILNEALVAYITKGIPVEETINNCNEMIKFQIVYRLTKDTKYAWHNGEYLSNKTYRVFASKDKKDTYIGKAKDAGGKIDRFQDTPDHCFIYNKSVIGIPISIKLDKEWYIETAKKSLMMFGYNMKTKNSLF